MKTQSERQAYMVRVIRTVDRALVEQSGLPARVISHVQTPQAAPGEREAVCIHGEGGRRQLLPYGVELEKQVHDARRWVREGEGARPLVAKRSGGGVELVGKAAPELLISLEEGAIGFGTSGTKGLR